MMLNSSHNISPHAYFSNESDFCLLKLVCVSFVDPAIHAQLHLMKKQNLRDLNTRPKNYREKLAEEKRCRGNKG